MTQPIGVANVKTRKKKPAAAAVKTVRKDFKKKTSGVKNFTRLILRINLDLPEGFWCFTAFMEGGSASSMKKGAGSWSSLQGDV